MGGTTLGESEDTLCIGDFGSSRSGVVVPVE